jgi:hypothetical protein
LFEAFHTTLLLEVMQIAYVLYVAYEVPGLPPLNPAVLAATMLSLRVNGVHRDPIGSRDEMGTPKQRMAARRNIKKAAAAAKRKQTLKQLPKRTLRALGREAAKARKKGS